VSLSTLPILFVVGYGKGDVGVGGEEGVVGVAILMIVFILQEGIKGNLYSFENTF
jgi:hypothetical protein